MGDQVASHSFLGLPPKRANPFHQWHFLSSFSGDTANSFPSPVKPGARPAGHGHNTTSPKIAVSGGQVPSPKSLGECVLPPSTPPAVINWLIDCSSLPLLLTSPAIVTHMPARSGPGGETKPGRLILSQSRAQVTDRTLPAANVIGGDSGGGDRGSRTVSQGGLVTAAT